MLLPRRAHPCRWVFPTMRQHGHARHNAKRPCARPLTGGVRPALLALGRAMGVPRVRASRSGATFGRLRLGSLAAKGFPLCKARRRPTPPHPRVWVVNRIRFPSRIAGVKGLSHPILRRMRGKVKTRARTFFVNAFFPTPSASLYNEISPIGQSSSKLGEG